MRRILHTIPVGALKALRVLRLCLLRGCVVCVRMWCVFPRTGVHTVATSPIHNIRYHTRFPRTYTIYLSHSFSLRAHIHYLLCSLPPASSVAGLCQHGIVQSLLYFQAPSRVQNTWTKWTEHSTTDSHARTKKGAVLKTHSIVYFKGHQKRAESRTLRKVYGSFYRT